MARTTPLSRWGALAIAAALAAGCAAPTATNAPTPPPTAPAGTQAPAASADLASAKDVASVLKAVSGLSAADRQKALLAKAEADGGSITWYVSIPSSLADDVVKAFQTQFPSLKIETNAVSGSALREQMLNEANANQHRWDVAVTNADDLAALKGQNIVATYDGPSLQGIDPKYRDPAGSWVAFYLGRQPIAYNTNLVPANAVPKDYEDFLDAKWKGKFTLDTEDFEWFDFILKTRGNEAGMTLHRGIAANGPVMVTGGGSAREPLVAGEVQLVTRVFDFTLLPLMQKGAPIDFVYPTKGALVTVAPMMLASNAPHPAAAVLLMDWATSQEGQQAMVTSSGRTPVRADVAERDPELQERAKGTTLIATDVLDFSSRFQDIQTQFSSIYLNR